MRVPTAMSALAFFRPLFAGCCGFIELRPVHDDDQSVWGRRRWLQVADGKIEPGGRTILNDYLADSERHGDQAFFGVALRATTDNGKASNLAWLPALFLDFDKIHRGRREAEIRRRMGDGPMPSIIVQSGGGLHC